MAPEQLQGKPTDARSDIFSFGCVFYEILTGKPAFSAQNKATLIAAIMDRNPEPLSSMIPPMIDHIVKKCLAKDPDDRWQSASDLKSELQWVLESGSNAGMPAPFWPLAAQHPPRLDCCRSPRRAAGRLRDFLLPHHTRAGAPFASKSRAEGLLGSLDFPSVSPDGSRMVFGATKRDAHATSGCGRWTPSTCNQFRNRGQHQWPQHLVARRALHSLRGGRQLAKTGDERGSPQILTSMPAGLVPAWSSAGIILFTGRGGLFHQIPASGGEGKPDIGSAPYSIFQAFCPTAAASSMDPPPGFTWAPWIPKREAHRRRGSGVFVPPLAALRSRSTLVAQAFDSGKGSLSGDPIPVADQVATVAPAPAAPFRLPERSLAYRRTSRPWQRSHLVRSPRQAARHVGEQATYTNPALSRTESGWQFPASTPQPIPATSGCWTWPAGQFALYLR